MENIINIVKNLNFEVVFIVCGIILFLILIILKGTFLQTGLRILTKRKNNFYYFVIPTFLAIILNMLLLFTSYILITKNGINLLDMLISYLFKSPLNYKDVIYVILAFFISEVLFIIIQAFILKLLPFDIIKSIKNLCIWIINKITKKSTEAKSENSNENNTQDTIALAPIELEDIESPIERPSFVNSLLSGLFCFAIMFFLTIILLYIGEAIGPSVIAKIGL